MIGIATLATSGAAQAPADSPEPVAAQHRTVAESPEALANAALWSVYFYANFTSAEWLPDELRPIDLAAAVEILGSEAPGIEPERRAAITWLAARGDQEHQGLLVALRAPSMLATLSLPQPPPRAKVASLKEAADLVPSLILGLRERLAAIHSMLEEQLGSAIPSCKGEVMIPVGIQKDLMTGATTATVHVSVKRDVSTVCSVLDPQRWDACSSYFAETHAAKKVANAYPIENDCSVKEALPSPALCSNLPYELYEDFEIPLQTNLLGSLVMAWYKQLLTITSTATLAPNGHIYNYDLYQEMPNPMCSRVGLDQRPGGLSINRGYVKLEQRSSDPAWTDIELTKTVLFSDRLLLDPGLNFMASFTLQGMADQLYKMACCSK